MLEVLVFKSTFLPHKDLDDLGNNKIQMHNKLHKVKIKTNLDKEI